MLDHLADVESDFSAIHGIWIDFGEGEYAGLSSRRLFQMAERLSAYPGVIQALAIAEEDKRLERGRPVAPTTDGGAVIGGGGGFEGVKVIPLTPEMAAHGMGALGLDGVVDYATSR